MSKKPQKVGEAAAPYTAKKPLKGKTAPKAVSTEQSGAANAAFSKVADKIFSERKELLHKLAQ